MKKVILSVLLLGIIMDGITGSRIESYKFE